MQETVYTRYYTPAQTYCLRSRYPESAVMEGVRNGKQSPWHTCGARTARDRGTRNWGRVLWIDVLETRIKIVCLQ